MNENTREENQLLLMRVVLGLNPAYDVLEAVRILFEEGRDAFEKWRGEPCDYAIEWKPSRMIADGPGYARAELVPSTRSASVAGVTQSPASLGS